MITPPIASSTALWFLTRGTGVVTLLLLTLVVVLGVINVRRMRLEGVPRFVIELVHRNAALLAVAFLVVHILTSVLDPFAPITLIDAVLPFVSAYRPLWLGLGTIASDLLLAVVITSLVRRRLGYGVWRAIHWLAYASWPVAIFHGLGTGSDAKTKWMLAVTAICVIAVLVAVVARVLPGWPRALGVRVAAIGACAALPIGLLAWLPSGPLGRNWARRAGTPVSVLAAAHGVPVATRVSSAPSSHHSAGSTLAGSFQAQVQGPVATSDDGAGNASIHMLLSVAGQKLSALHVLIEGQAINGGGVNMTSSAVTLGTASQPHLYRGRITALSGTNITAVVTNSAGQTIHLQIDLQLAPNGQSASGTLSASS
jgi:sulfoxide reductase heme-binding subunit YedZ